MIKSILICWYKGKYLDGVRNYDDLVKFWF